MTSAFHAFRSHYERQRKRRQSGVDKFQFRKHKLPPEWRLRLTKDQVEHMPFLASARREANVNNFGVDEEMFLLASEGLAELLGGRELRAGWVEQQAERLYEEVPVAGVRVRWSVEHGGLIVPAEGIDEVCQPWALMWLRPASQQLTFVGWAFYFELLRYPSKNQEHYVPPTKLCGLDSLRAWCAAQNEAATSA